MYKVWQEWRWPTFAEIAKHAIYVLSGLAVFVPCVSLSMVWQLHSRTGNVFRVGGLWYPWEITECLKMQQLMTLPHYSMQLDYCHEYIWTTLPTANLSWQHRTAHYFLLRVLEWDVNNLFVTVPDITLYCRSTFTWLLDNKRATLQNLPRNGQIS